MASKEDVYKRQVKGSGKTNDLFFTKDQVAAMSRDEIRKNFDAIERSRKKW